MARRARPSPIHIYAKHLRPKTPTLAHIDGRLREGRVTQALRRQLLAHIGPNPSVTQLQLVERCVWLALKCYLIETKIRDEADTAYDAKGYLAWSSAYQRSLLRLGIQPAASKEPSLADLLKAERAA